MCSICKTPEEARRAADSLCRGILLPDACLHFAARDLGTVSVADVLADTDRFVGQTLADPREGVEYGRCRAKVAGFQALAVLFPLAARNILRPAYDAGLLTTSEIAQHAEIPVRYVQFLMSDAWDAAYPLLTDFYDRLSTNDIAAD